MLTDRAHLEVRAGAGGNGSLSFRREAHVPKGGPDGGDGGRGGDVILRCDDSMRDLQSFRRRAHFRAERGGHGLGKQMHGADGDALIVAVPPGTQVERWDGTRYDLEGGDSVTFDADLPHHFENDGEEPTRFIAVIAAGLRRG